MQQNMSISGIGKQGIVTDVISSDLPPEVLTSGRNIRPTSEGVAFSGGYETLTKTPISFIPSFLIHNHVDDADVPFWLVAGSDSVWSFTDSWQEITPAIFGVDLSGSLWTGCNLGKMAMANHPDNGPIYFDVLLGTQAQDLPFSLGVAWRDAGKSFQVLRSHKNFLFALNLKEDGEEYPDGYRWSHPADANGYPFTWDENDLSGLASREALGGEDGAIVDGLSLRDSFIIYSEHGIDVLDYTGDDLLFKRRSLSTSAGLLAPNCVVEIRGSHFYITDGDVMINDGTNVKSIMKDKIRKNFIADINQDNYKSSYAVVNPLHTEVWFCIPSESSVAANLAYIYNYDTGAWTIRDLPAEMTCMASGAVSLPKILWSSEVGSWDSAVGSWSGRRISPKNETLVGSLSQFAGHAELAMIEASEAITETVEAFIERTDIAMAGIIQNTTLNALYPHMTGDVDMQIKVGSQDYPGAAVRWGPYKPYNPRINRKVDVRTTGALHAYRIQSSGKEPWRLSGMDVEFVARGLR